MKLIKCEECGDLVMLILEETRYCSCYNVAGKYLDDRITAVVSEEAIVVGIDNNGLNIATNYAMSDVAQDCKGRIDYFFTGWIPNHPGEVIIVKTIDDVVYYDYKMKDKDKTYESTLATESVEKNEKNKWSWNIFKKK